MTGILSDAEIVARKRHRCDDCLKWIEPGERYRRQVYADGEIYVYRAHPDCSAAVRELDAIANNCSGEFSPLYDIVDRDEDGAFLWAEFPRVAERLDCEPLSFAHRYVAPGVQRLLRWR